MQGLEEALGVKLFVRHSRGLTLTEEGAAMFGEGRDIAERMDAIFRRTQDAEIAPVGTVRISAAEPIGAHAMAPCFASMRDALPGINLELVIDNSPANLSHREADIAVRMFEPTQLDLVARRIGSVRIGLFASRRYLDRHGIPSDFDSSSGHTWIGMDRDAAWHRFLAEEGLSARDFGYRCDNTLAQIQAVRDGVGIGAMHVALGARDDELVRVLPDVQLPPLEMWLVMHTDLRGNAAVRAVFERLVAALIDYVETPETGGASSPAPR